MSEFGFGWRPDIPDKRDLLYSAPLACLKSPPPRVNLTPQMGDVYNQGSLGSCTAHAIATMFRYVNQKQGHLPIQPSRLFIYYTERELEGTVEFDSGAYIRDGMKAINQTGVCPEKKWPYNIDQFTEKPPPRCYRKAATHQAISYMRVSRSLNQMKGCLASGYPFVFGFTVYESFVDIGSDGKMPLPGDRESVLAGHAICCVGYDDVSRSFIIRNSWGDSWGDFGNFYMPYSYALDSDTADDFWTLRTVE